MIKKDCPICGSQKTRSFFHAGNWRVDWCPCCTNAWTKPPPAAIDYNKKDFHSQFSYREINDLPGQWKQSAKMQADLLTGFLSSDSKILEIGCGEGIFLKELERRGFRVRGIEPSVQASRRARDAGLNVTCGLFPQADITGPFDAVVMIQVLEHILQPYAFLKEVDKVAAGGVALIVQTNWRGLVPRFQKKRWYAWVPDQHFWHFTPKGMSVLMQRMGWQILALEYSSLHHEGSLLSRIGMAIPGLGDQFHVIAKILK